MANRYDIIQNAIDGYNSGIMCPMLPTVITKKEILNTFFSELYHEGSIDYAIPCDWSNDVIKRIGVNPTRHFVWFYPKREHIKKYGSVSVPIALNKKGIAILKQYNKCVAFPYPIYVGE